MPEIPKIYRITVPARPVGKQRPRMARKGRVFTPKQTVNAEAWVRLCCTQQVGTPLVSGPVALRIAFVVPIPGSMPVRDKVEARAARKLPVAKPDWDNLAKLVADALNGLAWRDDAHVAHAVVTKVYGDEPRTVIEWWQMTPEECSGVSAWSRVPVAVAALI